MQEGARKGDEAGRWLRDHFEGDPNLRVETNWTAGDEHDEVAYDRVLRLLFGPR